jgi:hypothetical protein
MRQLHEEVRGVHRQQGSEAGRAMMRQALDQQKAAWKQAASTPEGRSALATGCKAAEDQAKMAVQAYGCTW